MRRVAGRIIHAASCIIAPGSLALPRHRQFTSLSKRTLVAAELRPPARPPWDATGGTTDAPPRAGEKILEISNDNTVAASPPTGVDTITGEGLGDGGR